MHYEAQDGTLTDQCDALDPPQVRALAIIVRRCAGGASDFAKMLKEAKLHCGGALQSEPFWLQIVEEIALLDAAVALDG